MIWGPTLSLTTLFEWFSLLSNLYSSCFELCGEVDVVSDAVGVVIALLTGEAALGIANDSEVERGIFLDENEVGQGVCLMTRREDDATHSYWIIDGSSYNFLRGVDVHESVDR